MLRLRFADFERVTRSCTLRTPTADTTPLLAAARGLLSEAEPLIAERGLTLVGVTITNLGDPRAIQLVLPLERDRNAIARRGAGRGARPVRQRLADPRRPARPQQRSGDADAARLTRAASTLAGMCFDLDSLPPIPAIAGAAISHRDVVLEAADGNRLAAFAASPDEPGRTGIVVLPDVRGLYRFYEEVALRFAERGYPAIAFDYFGRSAGVGKRDDEFPYMEHVAQTTPEGVQADVAAAVAYLRSDEGGACERIFTVGFCFGGRNSWLAAAAHDDLAGAIGFYGSTGERNGRPGPVQLARADDGAHPGAAGGRRRRTSQPTTTRRSTARSPTPWSSTTSSRSRARRTPSSTASTRSSPTPRPMPGRAC